MIEIKEGGSYLYQFGSSLYIGEVKNNLVYDYTSNDHICCEIFGKHHGATCYELSSMASEGMIILEDLNLTPGDDIANVLQMIRETCPEYYI